MYKLTSLITFFVLFSIHSLLNFHYLDIFLKINTFWSYYSTPPSSCRFCPSPTLFLQIQKQTQSNNKIPEIQEKIKPQQKDNKPAIPNQIKYYYYYYYFDQLLLNLFWNGCYVQCHVMEKTDFPYASSSKWKFNC